VQANQLVETAFKLLPEDDIERARGYTVQGEIANDDDRCAEAVHFFEKALQLWRVAGNQRMTAWNLIMDPGIWTVKRAKIKS
jgi:hypothetical protein